MYKEIYIDESIHDKLGFIATAFIYTEQNIEREVKDALLNVDLEPKKDEFKSSTFMINNSTMQTLRNKLLNIASNTKIAIHFSASESRDNLGYQCLDTLSNIIIKNDINTEHLNVYFDEEIIKYPNKIDEYKNHYDVLKNVIIYPNENSIIHMGIQIADVVAHSVAQIIKEDLIGKNKMLDISGEETGYDEGTMAPLNWILKMSLRYSFFTRPVLYKSDRDKININTDPILIEDDEDIVDKSIEPELIGWGILIDDTIDEKIQLSIRNSLSKIWLGCIH